MRISTIFIILLKAISVFCPTDNYCKICTGGNHVMCKYKKGPSPACQNYKSSEITQEIKISIVEMHNRLRSNVARGLELRGNPGPQPPASNMLVMEWDDELAEIAQRVADQCFSHKQKFVDECRLTSRYPYGIMIASLVYYKDAPLDFTYAFKYWYNNVQRLNASKITKFELGNQNSYSYYTQMVWAKTRFIGCGHAAFQEISEKKQNDPRFIHRLVCNYGPAGNIVGASVYEMGEACSSCPEGFDCSKDYDGLCHQVATATVAPEGGFVNHVEIDCSKELDERDYGTTEMPAFRGSSKVTLNKAEAKSVTKVRVTTIQSRIISDRDGIKQRIFEEGDECYCGYVMRTRSSKRSLILEGDVELCVMLFMLLVFVQD